MSPAEGNATPAAGAESSPRRTGEPIAEASASPEIPPLDAWVLSTAPRAVAYATSLLGNRERAEDVVQDCYCRLLAKAGVYDLPRDGLKLLLKAISNACINVRTRNRFVGFWTLGHSATNAADVIDPTTREPDRRLMDQELEQAIALGLAQLPVAQRAALELKSQGASLQDIAEILEIGSSHAGVLVHRARKALAKHLEPFVRGSEP